MIPGTSLKGKVRTLLSRQYGADTETFYRKPNEDHAHIRRLFGDTEEYMTTPAPSTVAASASMTSRPPHGSACRHRASLMHSNSRPWPPESKASTRPI